MFLSFHLHSCPPRPHQFLTLSCQPRTCCEDTQEFSPPYMAMTDNYCWCHQSPLHLHVTPWHSLSSLVLLLVFSSWGSKMTSFFFSSSLLQICILLWLTTSTVLILHVFFPSWYSVYAYLCSTSQRESFLYGIFTFPLNLVTSQSLSLCIQLLLVRMLSLGKMQANKIWLIFIHLWNSSFQQLLLKIQWNCFFKVWFYCGEFQIYKDI